MFLVDTVDLLQLANGAPGARPRPIRHDELVLLAHELRHDAVDTSPDHLCLRHAEHLLHVSGGSSDDAHGLGIDEGFNDAGALVVYEFLELFDRV